VLICDVPKFRELKQGLFYSTGLVFVRFLQLHWDMLDYLNSKDHLQLQSLTLDAFYGNYFCNHHSSLSVPARQRIVQLVDGSPKTSAAPMGLEASGDFLYLSPFGEFSQA
jgi:hypothetical protein